MVRTRANEVESEAVRDLIVKSTLKEIDFHAVTARKLPESLQEDPAEDKVDVSVRLHHHVGDGVFGILLTVTMRPYLGEVEVAVAAEYEVEDGLLIDAQVVKAFGNEVAVMTLLPYAREAISNLTVRVWEKPFILPTLERGAVGFDLDELPS